MKPSRVIRQLLILASALLVHFQWACAQQPAVLLQGQEVPLYKASMALVIGASKYKTWPSLPNVERETAAVAAALRKQGFLVRHVIDPSGDTLQSAFRDFFAEYGGDPDNRLLVYYAGHGHSIGETGYLVGVDAPNPTTDLANFLKRSQSMSLLVAASKDYRARHALYVFDSCFSGAIFSARSEYSAPAIDRENVTRYLTGPAAFPLRQFITSGSESQRVPEVSQFTPLFLHAIEGRVGDLSRGGFVSAKEMGYWLQKQLSSYASNQTPQSGTILDARLDRGDFVFSPPALETQRHPAQGRPATTKVDNDKKRECFKFNDETYCQ